MYEPGKVTRNSLAAPHLIILIYLSAIFVGALALELPWSLKKPLPFIDALFMATSAITVTGLGTVNVYDAFTMFGHTVIMALIQLGGLGIMTLSSLFGIMLGRAVSMREASVFYDSFSSGHHVNIKDLIKTVLAFMFTIEAVGAVFLLADWGGTMPLGEALFASIFHSVAAFCNAGISIFPNALIGFEKDPAADLTICALIIFGGLGFITMTEIWQRRRDLAPRAAERLLDFGEAPPRRKALSLQTRMALYYSALLVGLGTLGYFVFEFNNTLAGRPLGEQVLLSFFHSVGARTAGFQNVDFMDLHNTTLNMIIILMYIGTAPGSTGGGVKVTTLGVVIALAVSRMRGVEDIQAGKRAVPEQTVRRAVSLLAVSVALLLLFITLLGITETPQGAARATHGQFMELIFEAVSAFGTVGYSMGVTATLSAPGKLLIMGLMLVGKLGPLTIALAVTAKGSKPPYQYAEEQVMIG